MHVAELVRCPVVLVRAEYRTVYGEVEDVLADLGGDLGITSGEQLHQVAAADDAHQVAVLVDDGHGADAAFDERFGDVLGGGGSGDGDDLGRLGWDGHWARFWQSYFKATSTPHG